MTPCPGSGHHADLEQTFLGVDDGLGLDARRRGEGGHASRAVRVFRVLGWTVQRSSRPKPLWRTLTVRGLRRCPAAGVWMPALGPGFRLFGARSTAPLWVAPRRHGIRCRVLQSAWFWGLARAWGSRPTGSDPAQSGTGRGARSTDKDAWLMRSVRPLLPGGGAQLQSHQTGEGHCFAWRCRAVGASGTATPVVLGVFEAVAGAELDLSFGSCSISRAAEGSDAFGVLVIVARATLGRQASVPFGSP